jgi:small-conductance mechanosensitive channel
MLDLGNLPASLQIGFQLVLIALAVIVAVVLIRAVVGAGMHHLLDRQQDDASGAVPGPEIERRVRTIGRLLVRVSSAVIVVIGVLMALDLFGIDIGPAVAGLGIVGIAVGFGAQTLIRDWLAGVFVVLENQYSAGDLVRIAGVEGTVVDFSLRRTALRDADGTVHTVPNGQITVASNLTHAVRAAAEEDDDPSAQPPSERRSPDTT